jgi:hypothetical protein
MYRHARKVSQYGHGTGIQAREPVTTLYVIAGIAATVALIAYVVGTVTGGGTTTVSLIAMAIFLVAVVAAFAVLLIIAIFW